MVYSSQSPSYTFSHSKSLNGRKPSTNLSYQVSHLRLISKRKDAWGWCMNMWGSLRSILSTDSPLDGAIQCLWSLNTSKECFKRMEETSFSHLSSVMHSIRQRSAAMKKYWEAKNTPLTCLWRVNPKWMMKMTIRLPTNLLFLELTINGTIYPQ